MRRIPSGLGAIFLFACTSAAFGQAPQPTEPPLPTVPYVEAPIVDDAPDGPRNGLEAESLPGEIAEDLSTSAPRGYRYGATPVSEVGILSDFLGLRNLFGDRPLRTFGWVEGGYTGTSVRPGLLSVQPRQNRYGDEFLLNQIGLVLQKPLEAGRFNLGFNIRYFAGADAALGQPRGGIGSTITNTRFSQDFRDLYLSAHLPIFTEGGMDVKFGRMNSIIGYNGFLAPYRPFYSSDYQFFYSQDGAFTGLLTDLHVNDRLDVWNGITLGANTFFTLRSEDSFCYIGQVNYWLNEEKTTRLTGSVYLGPNAVFAAPGMAGDFATTLEIRLQQNWSERFTQIVQSNMGWDRNTPTGTGSWYGVYTIGLFHLDPTLDLNVRGDWFYDVQGTRTGFASSYSAVTVGLNWHPLSFLEVRPEVRGDFASAPAFGGGGSPGGNFSQFSGVISALVKF